MTEWLNWLESVCMSGLVLGHGVIGNPYYLGMNCKSCCCLIAQSCLTLCNFMDCSTPGFTVHYWLPELTLTHVHQVGDAIQPFQPLLSHSTSIFPSIRVFSKESVLCIRRPKYWSFSFSISPSNEYAGLISFRMNWFDLLAVQGTLKSHLQHHSSKASILGCSAFFISFGFNHDHLALIMTNF